jgi:hydroxyethylthiazole kinase-like uncharacterized protein yjeF
MKLVTTDEMRALEAKSEAVGVSTDTLMETAGLTIAHEAAQLLPDYRGRLVVILVGPGNNGGDGLVTARHLQNWRANVVAYLCVPGKALASKLELAVEAGVEIVQTIDDSDLLPELLDRAALVIDSMLGIGQARSVEAPLKGQLALLAQAKARRPDLKLLAVDIPTGLNADSGEVDPVTVKADLTVTLGAPKIGLYTTAAAEVVGRIVVGGIGLPPGLDADLPAEVMDNHLIGPLLPRRPIGANKGTFGRALVVGGSHRYLGAPYLACAAAGRVGAGLVTLASVPLVRSTVATMLPEVTHLPLAESNWTVAPEAAAEVVAALAQYEALLVGCGLGDTAATRSFVQQLLLSGAASKIPTVVDADALNALARLRGWSERMTGAGVLTPHPGEMARLTGLSIIEVQRGRLACARTYAEQWGRVVVLKGAYTVIASQDGRARVSPFANPALASAGTGDTLAGAIVGLLAQGLDTFDAASCGVYVHASAGERVAAELGDSGLLASDLLPLFPRVMKALFQETA